MWPFSCKCDKEPENYNVGKTVVSFFNTKNELMGTMTVYGNADYGLDSVWVLKSFDKVDDILQNKQFYKLDDGTFINRNHIVKITKNNIDHFKSY